MSLRERMLELEDQSRLTRTRCTRNVKAREQVIAYSENFLNKVDSLKAYNPDPTTRELRLLDSPISEEGADIDEQSI